MKQPKCRTCGKEHRLGAIWCSSVEIGGITEGRERHAPREVSRGPVKAPGQVAGASRAAETEGTQAPSTNTNSEPFDRKKYQMLFMRDKRKADKLGLKVSEYRKMKGNENE